MKKATSLMLILVVCLFSAIRNPLMAQDSTKAEKELKNTIHFNVSNQLIFGSRSLVFGYERLLNKRRSFSINAGQTGFPTLSIIFSDSVKSKALVGQGGFSVSGDYRFYLSKENKYNAPRGVYLGPYFSYNYFEKKHSWDVTSTAGGSVAVESKTDLAVGTIGVEMGYQFVFWRRLSIDMVLIGPGLASYKLQAELGTNLSSADKEKLFEKLNEALADRFPGYSVAVDEEKFKKSGSTNTTNLGYRYLFQIGYRF